MWHPACAGSGSHVGPAMLCAIDLLRKYLSLCLLPSLTLSLCLSSQSLLSFIYIYVSIFSYPLVFHFNFQLLHTPSRTSLNHSPFFSLSTRFHLLSLVIRFHLLFTLLLFSRLLSIQHSTAFLHYLFYSPPPPFSFFS